MRKLYALLAGLCISLASIQTIAQQPTTDIANFTFTVDASTNNVVFSNTTIIGDIPGTRHAIWSFGDGTSQLTGLHDGTQHQYLSAGTYTVCLKIFRFVSNTNDSVLSAQECKTIVIESLCRANFEYRDFLAHIDPLKHLVYFWAIPFHNANKPVTQVCWNFGDGTDTCINISPTVPPTNLLAVQHTYYQQGPYNVCVRIKYLDGCVAEKCKLVVLQNPPPDSCRADFERLPLTVANHPLYATFKALPWHNNNKKPTRICWSFGDGKDTCIQYVNTYTGPYTVNHLYTAPGVYEVCLKILYQGGCEAGNCKRIQIARPDSCRADFETISVASNSLRKYFIASPWHNNHKKPSLICWTFGDGKDTCIKYMNIYNGRYAVAHTYREPGLYEVCIKILYYGGCESKKCKTIQIGNPDSCKADFERVPVLSTNDPLRVYFKALPWHNNHKKPQAICWTFGDGRDTCIKYASTFTGIYAVGHKYNESGTYEVCVKILYYGGCESRKCKPVVIESPDKCSADFEQIQTTANTPLRAYFRVLPKHNNNKKPEKICWKFGDGKDTCIKYEPGFTGQYVVGHSYLHPGLYEVCVYILYTGGCEVKLCKPIQIGEPDRCAADFEKLPTTANTALRTYFRALPKHNNNKKPEKICWKFGDGKDTCIKYEAGFTGQYVVAHNYLHAGQYEVCVYILYAGGCEAKLCKAIQIGEPDRCAADFEQIPTTNISLRTYFRALPKHNNDKKPEKICWKFGDGKDTCIKYEPDFTGQYVVGHTYLHPGLYEVCVSILYAGGCEAKLCKPIQIGEPDSCRADFETISVSSTSLRKYFTATPWHNHNKKPIYICWTFGDNHDTCIQYSPTHSGPYAVGHTYSNAGQYEVCVRIVYESGCEAKKCKLVQIGEPDSCTADFERSPLQDNDPLTIGLKALPWNNHNHKPARICWTFGDGRDTCISYPENYTGLYVVGHRYHQPGQYEVCIKILYYGGCEAKKCKLIIIPPTEHDTCAVRLFEITPSVTSLVRGFFASPSSNPNRKPERICWWFGDGRDTCVMINPQAANPLSDLYIRHTYPGPGVYRACVKISFDGGCIAYDCREVVIRSFSNVCGGYMIDSLAGPRNFVFKGFSIHNPNDQPVSFRWTFGDGSAAIGQEVKHTYNVGGTYEVCLYIKTQLGCETRICKTVRVPGNNEPTLHLSPNPVITTLHIEFFSTHTEQVNIKILNASGIVVRNYIRNVTVGPNNWDVDLSSLIQGIYSFVVQSPNQLASAIFLKGN